MVPTPEQRQRRQLQRDVTAIMRRHLQEACDRAWVEIAERGERPALLALHDPVAAPARVASRALVGLLTDGLSRLALAALVLPSRPRRPRQRWTEPPPSLAAIPGGLRPKRQAPDGPPPLLP